MLRKRSSARRLCMTLGGLVVFAPACAPDDGQDVGTSAETAFSEAEGEPGFGEVPPDGPTDGKGPNARPLDGSAVDTTLDPASAGLPRWAPTATVGSVRGRVFAAESGQPLAGWAVTTAKCEGAGCTRSENFVYVPVTAGAFVFEADATTAPAKKALLELNPTTPFTIQAEGYRSVVVAHGPSVAVEQRTVKRSPNSLPDVYLCVPEAKDRDHDGICDAAEARYGTDPKLQDSDGDALSDTMELYGHPHSGEDNYYDLYSLGADPLHGDVFLAVRFLQKAKFTRAALAPVIKAFDASPYSKNRDNTKGLHLNILFDERPIVPDAADANLSPVWAAFDRIKVKNFGERPYAFHYALFGDTFDGRGNSGVSRGLGGAEFVVTLGAGFPGTVEEQAGTLMHELGHNLGLHHNGYTDENNLPHYPSVMNYLYQFSGVSRTSGTSFDYADVSLGVLDEQHINENKPFTPVEETTDAMLAAFTNPRVSKCPPKGQPVVIKGNFAGPLDLNCDKKLQADLSFDLNGDDTIGKLPETRNDWASLTLGGGPTGLVGDAPIFSVQRVLADFETTEPCATASDARAFLDAQLADEVPVVDPSSPTPSPETPTVPADDRPQVPSSPTDDSRPAPTSPTDDRPQVPSSPTDDSRPAPTSPTDDSLQAPNPPTDDAPPPNLPTEDSPQAPAFPTDDRPETPPESIDDVNNQTPADPADDVNRENPTDLTEKRS